MAPKRKAALLSKVEEVDEQTQVQCEHVGNQEDREFLEKAKAQLKSWGQTEQTFAGHSTAVVLRHLHHVELACRTCAEEADSPNAYFVSSNDARNLAETRSDLNVPIFTECPETSSWLDEKGLRPIEQLLERFPNDDEQLPIRCPQCPNDHEYYESLSIVKLKEIFKQQRKSKEPWNVVDLLSPLPSSTVLFFLASPNCSFLTDIRPVLSVDTDDDDRMQVVREHWEQFQNLFFIAETGASTPPHYDPYGYATYISCLEGELGFAWADRPSEADLNNWRANEDDCHDKLRWLYRVLRKGDTIFFPPGTIHYVFRLPEGEQTFTASGHLVRRTNITQWLRLMSKNIEDAITAGAVSDMANIVPHLLEGLERLLKITSPCAPKKQKKTKEIKKTDDTKEVEDLIAEIRGHLNDLKSIKRKRKPVDNHYHLAKVRMNEDEISVKPGLRSGVKRRRLDE